MFIYRQFQALFGSFPPVLLVYWWASMPGIMRHVLATSCVPVPILDAGHTEEEDGQWVSLPWLWQMPGTNYLRGVKIYLDS